jgi:hypothetical protein
VWDGVTWQLGMVVVMLAVLRCSVVVSARLLAGVVQWRTKSRRVGLFIAVILLCCSYVLRLEGIPSSVAMRYLTHLVLFQLSREVKPDRRRRARDPFGLDAAACWCAFLEAGCSTSAPPLSHANSSSNQHHITCADIELERLTPSGKSRAIVPAQDTSEVTQATWPTQMPHPRQPPTAHCRPQSSKQQHTRNNHHNTAYQTSPLSK